MGIRPTSEKFPLLIVLNPNAGKKNGLELYSKTIQPALNNAQIPSVLVTTTEKGFAQEYFTDNIGKILIDLAQSLTVHSQPSIPQHQQQHLGNAKDSSGDNTPPKVILKIMVIGGDGTVHEIINGILEGVHNPALDTFLNEDFFPKIEFSIIPTGTGNAIATSQGMNSPQAALDRYLSGHSVPLRVVQVSKRSDTHTDANNNIVTIWKPVMYTAVVISFGLHCATVFDAEGYRSLGNTRFKVSALKNIMFLKQYPAHIEIMGPYQKYDRILNQLVSNTDPPTTTAASVPSEEQQQQQQSSTILQGPFTYLMLTKQSSLEPGFVPTPFANTSDEWIDLFAVQNAGRGQIADILGDALKEGRHVKEREQVEYYKAKMIEMEIPTAGRLCVDGEFMDVAPGPEGRIRFEIVTDPAIQLFYLYA
ncbi:hypothetical protein FBU30_003933 [Linnemannia zychae]|nr:hypothetical protein FBU30_003933 [Linnemannia zychae]